MVAAAQSSQEHPESTGAEPVAVIGIGCRFPGDAGSPDAFWELLGQGRNTTAEVPHERWQWYRDLGPEFAAALRRAIKWGSFLPGIEEFDAEFFGVTPREAELMDPQQRILLEVAWEALEHAGIATRELAAGDAGVFVGACTHDYGRRQLEDLPNIEAWTGIGAANCALANRISYALDLRGPSVVIDTACSASLVATHLACQSLRLRESDVTLVGGVNLLVSPGETITLGSAGALAPDGRSKSFDASADGYGRGEGCGVLVLKRLADAQSDGDRVLAVIRGSAVNQDGRTNGIMAPSGTAQAHVMTRACANAGTDPASVDYIEAHGTGTRLGDPLEAEALSAVYGSKREPGQPCLIGSVKSNIGHLEGAAGVAGIIKTVLALAHSVIPASPLVTELTSEIPWDDSGLRVVTDATAWPRNGRPRRAGVSGFGYGGTVAHVVLEEAPEAPERAVPGDGIGVPRLYPLSAGPRAALPRQAGRLADWLSSPAGAAAPLNSVGHTLALRRSHLDHRAAIVAADRDELTGRLRELAAGQPGELTATGSPLPDHGAGLVWVFSGHGAQWAGMGRELLTSEPAFAAVIDELEPVFAAEIGFSPRQALLDGDFDTVDRIQTMIFAMQVGLAAVWRSYGVTPDAVIGHSVGEIAAAVTRGSLSLADGGRLICRRSLLLRRVAGHGAMAMVSLPFDDVALRLSDRDDVVAAISASPASTVVAGSPAAVERLITDWRAQDLDVRRVASDVAFHSPQMDPLLDELAAAAADLPIGVPGIPMYSTALTDPRGTPVLDGSYWAVNLRNPVRLAAAVTAAAEDGYRAFLEISAHPVVAHSIAETLAERKFGDVLVGTSLRRDRPEVTTLLESAADLHCHGFALDWAALQPAGDLVGLPTTAWQHRRHWRDRPATGAADGAQHDPDSRTLLGAPTTVAGSPLRLWRSWLDDSSRPYPGSHAINGVEIVPAAVLVNSFFAAVSGAGPPPVLTDVSMRLPLMTGERRAIQVVLDDGAVRLASRAADSGTGQDPPWLTHATARVAPAAADLPDTLPDGHPSLRPAERGLVQQRLAQVGVPETGFSWTVEHLMRGNGVLRGKVRLPQAGAPTWAPVLDAVMSLAPVAYPGEPILRMVVHAGEIVVTGRPPDVAVVDIVVRADQDDTVDALVAGTDGRVVARVAGLRYAVIGQEQTAAGDPRRLVHELVWRPLELPDTGGQTGPGPDIVIVSGGADREPAAALCRALTQAGVPGRVAAGLPDRESLGTATDVLVMIGSTGDSTEPAWSAAASSAALLARTARQLGEVGEARLWCLTTGAQDSATESSLTQSSSWAVGRVLAGERADLWGGIIDLDPRDPAADVQVLLALIRAAPGEDAVALRDGAATVARLLRVAGEPLHPVPYCRAGGTYLVTGGLGTFGLRAAAWLAERGARRIVLADRRPAPPRREWDEPADQVTRGQIDAIRALEADGVTVAVLSLDLTDPRQVPILRDADALGLPPILGVIHAADDVAESAVTDLDTDPLRQAMRPLAAGAWALHELFPPGSIDFLVLFSSCGHLLSEVGQAQQGAAAAFLGTLAAHRAAAPGDHTVNIAWTSQVSVAEAVNAWEFAAGHGAASVAVLRPGDAAPVPLLRDSVAQDARDAQEAQATEPDESGSLVGLSPEQVRDHLQGEIAAQIATEMKLPTADLDPRRSLVEQGLDSVMTMMVRRRLERRFGHSLPATLLWQKPTVVAIAEHLAELLAAADAAELESADNDAKVPVAVG